MASLDVGRDRPLKMRATSDRSFPVDEEIEDRHGITKGDADLGVRGKEVLDREAHLTRSEGGIDLERAVTEPHRLGTDIPVGKLRLVRAGGKEDHDRGAGGVWGDPGEAGVVA